MKQPSPAVCRTPRQAPDYRVPKAKVAALRAVTGGTHGVSEVNALADQLKTQETRYLGTYPPALAHYRQPELWAVKDPESQWEEILEWGGLVSEVSTYATSPQYNPALRAHATTVTELATCNWVLGQANFQAAVAKARNTPVPYPKVRLETTLGTVEWSTETPDQVRWVVTHYSENYRSPLES